jgi:hypothetical protein
MKLEFSRQIFKEKKIDIIYYENPSRGDPVVPCEGKHGR